MAAHEGGFTSNRSAAPRWLLKSCNLGHAGTGGVFAAWMTIHHVEIVFGPPGIVRHGRYVGGNHRGPTTIYSRHYIPSFSLGDALMSTTARLDDLKRDLARLERKRTGPPREGHAIEEGRGREAEHPGQIPSRGWMDVLWRA